MLVVLTKKGKRTHFRRILKFFKLVFKLKNTKRLKVIAKTIGFLKKRNKKLRFFKFYYRGGFVLKRMQKYTNYFFVYKLGLRRLSQVPKLQSMAFRSTYVGRCRKKSEMYRVSILLNMYFLLRVTWFNFGSLVGTSLETTKGWSWKLLGHKNLPALEVTAAFNYLTYHILQGLKKIDLMSISYNWRKLKPIAWVSLRMDVRRLWSKNKRRLTANQYKYWILEGKKHILQFKILCRISGENKNMLATSLKQRQNWFLKSMLLRYNHYPVIFDYKDLAVLSKLTLFGPTSVLLLDNLENPETTWQADYWGVQTKEVLDDLNEILIKKERAGFYTEMSMTQSLYQAAQAMDDFNVSYLLSMDLLFKRPTLVVRTLSRRWLTKAS